MDQKKKIDIDNKYNEIISTCETLYDILMRIAFDGEWLGLEEEGWEEGLEDDG